jgi:hypothetical protein
LSFACPASLKECGKVMAQYQSRTSAITGRKSGLDPRAHGVFVSSEKAGDFLYRVAAMDFDIAMVWVAFCHDRYPDLFTLSPGAVSCRDGQV